MFRLGPVKKFAYSFKAPSKSMNLAGNLESRVPPPSSEWAICLGDVTRTRIGSIDLLRGLVMVLMALDHTRDFFGTSGMNPRDVADPALFLTRWITHFCAPTFILLAGVSAYLYGARAHSVGELSRFLFTRGLWLVLLELTVVRLGWRFNFDLSYFVFQVIWVIGASMIVLAALVYMPRWAIAAIGLGMIGGHNLLDAVRAEEFARVGWVWNFLHQPGLIRARNVEVFPLYTLIPWVGVMATGYALGPVIRLERARRLTLLLGIGIGITVGFVLLRAANVYGDPVAWTVHRSWPETMLSFINCEKYPPSLLYLMMTLGPALLLLAAFESVHGRLASWITAFGRVPLFYYVGHIYLIHLLAVIYAAMTVGDMAWLFGDFARPEPGRYGLPLSGIYGVWLFVVVALYPSCRWFATLKNRRQQWWLSYL
jgi:uncharacterized membrane protein